MAAWTQHQNLNDVLTERQREVLGLIAAGRTNPEIAEALGVSLAGAKWHVSEVISRLGVETREEAAEVWRDANALPRRFMVWARGLAGVGLMKATAGVVGTVAVVGAGVGTIAVVRDIRAEDAAVSAESLGALRADYARNEARVQSLITATVEPGSLTIPAETHPSVPSNVAASFSGAGREFDILVGDMDENWPIALRVDEGELSWVGFGGNTASPRLDVNSNEDMFGVSAFASAAGFSTIYGAVSSRVVRVEILLEDGRTASVIPQTTPPGSGYPYNVFGAAFPGTSWIQEARAFDVIGAEVGFYSTAGHPTKP